MTAVAQVLDAFNRHGSFTARMIPDVFGRPAVEVRFIDTGDIAATVWGPAISDHRPSWTWLAGQPGVGLRRLPENTPVDALVRAVATHVLDEGAKR